MTLTIIEQIRLLINDKDSVIFPDDADLQFFYDEESNIYGAASLALLSLASDVSRTTTAVKIGSFSSSSESSVKDNIIALAKEYRAKAQSSIRSDIVQPDYNDEQPTEDE